MERIVGANGIEICTECFGDPSHPAVMMIAGASSQGCGGPDDLIVQLVTAGGRSLIRYDARDTGKSTCFDFATNPYTLTDMAQDAVGVLDAYGVEAAHLFGGSMGGMVSQEIAIEHPDRVRTLTSFMSTPAVSITDTAGEWTSGLPPMHDKVLALFATLGEPPATRDERLAFSVRMFEVLAGSLVPFDPQWAHDFFSRQLDRGPEVDTSGNHSLAISASRDRTALLASVTAPTLVIHGTEDPIIPYEHGVATAKAIPGAQLLTIEGLGHEFPPPAIPRIIDAVLEFTA